MKDRRVKANRAQADYFELLVAQHICHLYKIRFSYSKDLVALSDKILAVPDGANRFKLQNRNFRKLIPKLKKILSYEISQKGKIIEVIWLGRKLTIKTTSDVDAEHITHKLTRFSIKSISESGLGTIKNLGMRSLKEYLSIDFSPDYQKMWRKLRSFAKKPDLSNKKLKMAILNNKRLFNFAFKNGKKYQNKLNQLCFKAFNDLSKENKLNFFDFILDAKDKDLYVVIANSKGVVVYKPNDKKLKSISKINAKKESNVGYTIYIDNIPTYRIQTNATNGIGISPFCQRVFFVDTKQ